MRFSVLGSGSAGNCLLIEAGGVRVLVEAGLSLKETRRRAALLGIALDRVDAVLITHEHTDHVAHAARLSRGLEAPLYLNRGTELASSRFLTGEFEVRHFRTGDVFALGDLRVETIAKPHDAADPVTLLLSEGASTLGVFTDLGHVDTRNAEALSRCTHLFIEANHDPDLLANGPYPAALKRRVASDVGHLSNDEAARAVADAAPNLSVLVLGHVSEKNNHGALLRQSFVSHLGENPGYCRWVSRQDRPTAFFGARGEVLQSAHERASANSVG